MTPDTCSVLIVDDDAAMRQMLGSLFGEQGYQVQQASSAAEALELASEREFDAILSDIKMPGKSGIAMVGELRHIRPDTPVVLMTAFGSIDSAVEAMRAGAFDYITKPFEPEAVLLTLERAIEQRALEEENRRLRRAVDQTSSFGDLIGGSPAMREIFALIRKVAHGRSSVLITGESGTGKEVVARTLHYHGSRADKPFVPINCTALPEGLLESELFGHVRGAFTGAHTSKRGLFEKANGGTLFLDEIGDMSLGLQSKLLRVLQDGEIRPVGGNQATKVDVRIVAATNKDLQEEMEEGRFREDLYYRLNVIPIRIPPLRERPEDVPALADAFVRKHSDGSRRSLSPQAIDRLKTCTWKGNARELENVIERALALSDEVELGVEDLPIGRMGNVQEGFDVVAESEAALQHAAREQISLRDLEELYIEEVLKLTRGNKVQAAKILGIDRKTLYRRAERRSHAH
ncbi:MAG: sigma-54 dependent transcriptional regulator [Myxococcales bacterium]|nr:sigma-54 dependent transcriptional regulator [Myxococcales bacterium]MDH5306606.1 sigma-54 dependent transcriptional regulator [Myxococcales bacterium]MDH5565837.1 sigma-54 dependent transcriptional regulator [Myxococcales bacterium]